jgi:hypothetical protein
MQMPAGAAPPSTFDKSASRSHVRVRRALTRSPPSDPAAGADPSHGGRPTSKSRSQDGRDDGCELTLAKHTGLSLPPAELQLPPGVARADPLASRRLACPFAPASLLRPALQTVVGLTMGFIFGGFTVLSCVRLSWKRSFAVADFSGIDDPPPSGATSDPRARWPRSPSTCSPRAARLASSCASPRFCVGCCMP